jgi:oligopeptide transport system ATP-binding protein
VSEGKVLLEVNNLKKYFEMTNGFFGREKTVLKAVDDVSLYIKKGETLGLVGESGCGKTTIGRTIIKLYEATDGRIIFDGKDITHLSQTEMLPYRKRMQMIFQDPYASLNSRMTVGDIIGEPLDIHDIARGQERKEIIQELLRKVGLNSEHANRYPHEFSGGQRQRIGIARALAVQPEFIICDEPISALDVSIQAQVVNLLEDLQNDLGLTYLFIAHDLSMVKHISNRVGVMYLGKLAELTSSRELYKRPLHPYTKALLSAIPVPDPKTADRKQRIILEGDVPSPMNPPSGCRFRTRCLYAEAICGETVPELREVASGHWVACHLVHKIN